MRRVSAPSGSSRKRRHSSVGDDEAEHPVAEKFEPLVMRAAAVAAGARPRRCAASALGMGQRLGQQVRPGESMADFSRDLGRRISRVAALDGTSFT